MYPWQLNVNSNNSLSTYFVISIRNSLSFFCIKLPNVNYQIPFWWKFNGHIISLFIMILPVITHIYTFFEKNVFLIKSSLLCNLNKTFHYYSTKINESICLISFDITLLDTCRYDLKSENWGGKNLKDSTPYKAFIIHHEIAALLLELSFYVGVVTFL